MGQPPPGAPPKAPPVVLVDDEATTVKRLVAEGVALADAGKFDEACAKFLEAFRIKPTYDVAGDLGGVELEAHRYRDAAEHLSYSLREYPPTGEPVIKADTQKKLALARAEVASVRLHASVAGAVLKIDGATKGVAPIDHELYVEAGDHGFDAVLPGYKPAHVQRTVDKGKETLIDLLLVKDGAAASDGHGPASSGPSPVALGIGYGLGGGAAVAGAVMFGLGFSKKGQANDLRATLDRSCVDAAGCAKLDDLTRQQDALVTAGGWTLIGGAALLLGTGIYHVVASRQRAISAWRHLVPAVSIGPGFGSLSVTSSF